MINHAKIEIPDPNEQLSLGEAVRVIQAMAEDMMATERHVARLETVLGRCRAYFEDCNNPFGDQILREIEEVLK